MKKKKKCCIGIAKKWTAKKYLENLLAIKCAKGNIERELECCCSLGRNFWKTKEGKLFLKSV